MSAYFCILVRKRRTDNAQSINFSPESRLSINENGSTLSVGGFFEICAPKGTCSEPHPSPASGENTVQKDYLFKNLIETWEIVK